MRRVSLCARADQRSIELEKLPFLPRSDSRRGWAGERLIGNARPGGERDLACPTFMSPTSQQYFEHLIHLQRGVTLVRAAGGATTAEMLRRRDAEDATAKLLEGVDRQARGAMRRDGIQDETWRHDAGEPTPSQLCKLLDDGPAPNILVWYCGRCNEVMCALTSSPDGPRTRLHRCCDPA